jgi:hypothetical protein
MLPTYKRVLNMRLPVHIQSAIECVSDLNNIAYTFLVNDYDDETINYLHGLEGSFEFQVLYTNLKFPNLSNFYNQLYSETKFNDPGIIVSMIGDDMIWKTKNFDLIILEKINECDGKGIVWCNDDYIGKDKCCINLFTTRKIVEASNHPFMCEMFTADYIDVIWYKIAKAMKIDYYLSDVILRHEHNRRLPKEQWDVTRNRLVEQIKISRGNESKIDAYVNEIVEELKKNL